jgi:hypothetical protein
VLTYQHAHVCNYISHSFYVLINFTSNDYRRAFPKGISVLITPNGFILALGQFKNYISQVVGALF